MIRIAQGINYLHSNLLIHRDIKPHNILIDHDHIPYISDFDTVKNTEMQSENTNDIGSIKYMSSKQFHGQNYSFPTDIFSFGQLIYFLYEKKNQLENGDYESFINKIENKSNIKLQNAPESILNIFKKCLKSDDKSRPTIKEIVEMLKNDLQSYYFLEL